MALPLVDNATPTPDPVALSVGNNNTNTTYSGVLSGGGSLTKIGTGTLILSGNNTYAGGTTINAGILSVGTISDSSPSNIGTISNPLTLGGGTLR